MKIKIEFNERDISAAVKAYAVDKGMIDEKCAVTLHTYEDKHKNTVRVAVELNFDA